MKITYKEDFLGNVKIETKFDLKQKVWFIDEYVNANKETKYDISSDIIESIKIDMQGNIEYGLTWYSFFEDELFDSREDAIEYLKNNKQVNVFNNIFK